MKTVICLLGLTCILGVAIAAEKKEEAPTTKPVNKMCAVQPENPVDDRVIYMHEGKAIGFCCSDCIPTFKENPAKYVDKMK
jgi:YHS domain-containing protein